MFQASLGSLAVVMLSQALSSLPALAVGPVGSAFTYQGLLAQSGQPLPDGSVVDLQFSLWDGSGVTALQIGSTLQALGMSINDGLVMIELDFGAAAFAGQERWLQIAVRSPAGSGSFTTLAPRQAVRPSPYSIFSLSVGLVPNAALTGIYTNAVTFSNGTNSFTGAHAGSGAGLTSLSAGSISGTLGSGLLSGSYGGITGVGTLGSMTVTGTTTSGSFTGSGANLTNLNAANIASNSLNVARMPTGGAWALGGNLNIDANTLFVDATNNRVGVGTSSPSTALHVQGNVMVTGWIGTSAFAPVDIFSNNARVLRLAYAVNSLDQFSTNTIAGAAGNSVTANVIGAAIGGGGEATVYGFNLVTDHFGTIGGGAGNRAGNPGADTYSETFATVSGGQSNLASAQYATVCGGQSNDVSAGYATVGGGRGNIITSLASAATVAGGELNRANNSHGTVAGGESNVANGAHDTIGGGWNNVASGPIAMVAGGDGNHAESYGAAVGGGHDNNASGTLATVGGGESNMAGGLNSTVPGGDHNRANGQYSFAAGRQAKADHDSAFVWADSQGADFLSTGPNQFLIRAAGGVGINTSAPGSGNVSIGLGDKVLQVRSDSGVVPGLNLTGTGGNVGILRVRNRIEMWPNDAATTASSMDLRNTSGTPTIVFDGGSGAAFKTGGGSWSAISDARLKTAIADLEPGSLDRLLKLHGRTLIYTRKAIEEKCASPGVQTGFIAQEVEQVFPDWVNEDAEGYKYITERGTTALMVEALRDLRAEKDAQLAEKEARIDRLSSELDEVKAQMKELQEQMRRLAARDDR